MLIVLLAGGEAGMQMFGCYTRLLGALGCRGAERTSVDKL